MSLEIVTRGFVIGTESLLAHRICHNAAVLDDVLPELLFLLLIRKEEGLVVDLHQVLFVDYRRALFIHHRRKLQTDPAQIERRVFDEDQRTRGSTETHRLAIDEQRPDLRVEFVAPDGAAVVDGELATGIAQM